MDQKHGIGARPHEKTLTDREEREKIQAVPVAHPGFFDRLDGERGERMLNVELVGHVRGLNASLQTLGFDAHRSLNHCLVVVHHHRIDAFLQGKTSALRFQRRSNHRGDFGVGPCPMRNQGLERNHRPGFALNNDPFHGTQMSHAHGLCVALADAQVRTQHSIALAEGFAIDSQLFIPIPETSVNASGRSRTVHRAAKPNFHGRPTHNPTASAASFAEAPS